VGSITAAVYIGDEIFFAKGVGRLQALDFAKIFLVREQV
jgi:hypothetical protein